MRSARITCDRPAFGLVRFRSHCGGPIFALKSLDHTLHLREFSILDNFDTNIDIISKSPGLGRFELLFPGGELLHPTINPVLTGIKR